MRRAGGMNWLKQIITKRPFFHFRKKFYLYSSHLISPLFYIGKILEKDHIELSNFNQKETWINVSGGKRKAMIYPGDLKYEINPKSLNLVFNLNKGSYATSLIREIVNNNKNAEKMIGFTRNYDDYLKTMQQFFIFPQSCKSLF